MGSLKSYNQVLFFFCHSGLVIGTKFRIGFKTCNNIQICLTAKKHLILPHCNNSFTSIMCTLSVKTCVKVTNMRRWSLLFPVSFCSLPPRLGNAKAREESRRSPLTFRISKFLSPSSDLGMQLNDD